MSNVPCGVSDNAYVIAEVSLIASIGCWLIGVPTQTKPAPTGKEAHMADVHVVFTKKGNNVDVVAMPEMQPLVDEDMIFWHVRSEHPDIHEVEIDFEKAEAKFFEFGSGSNVQHETSYRKRLKKRSSAVAKTKGKKERRWKWSVMIWGQAPQYALDAKPDKYWIKGYQDGVNEPIVELDPVIITTKPRP